MGDDALYRFWDATAQTEFLFEMATQALDVHLIEEVHFLNNFDAISKKVAEEYDLEQIVLFKLVSLCLERNGKFSKRIREKFAERVGFPSVYDRIEELTQKALLDQDLDDFD